MKDKRETTSDKDETKWIGKIYALAVIIAFLTVAIFIIHFYEKPISEQSSHWGEFGDYIGGTLNPIFALLSFFALLHTIKLQQQELKLTREELKKSVKAQESTAAFSKNQNEITEKHLEIIEKTEKKNDILKIIEQIDQNIKAILRKEKYDSQTSGKSTIRHFIEIASANTNKQISQCHIYQNIKAEIKELENEINIMLKLIDDFNKLAEHKYLEEYYKSVYIYLINYIEKTKNI